MMHMNYGWKFQSTRLWMKLYGRWIFEILEQINQLVHPFTKSNNCKQMLQWYKLKTTFQTFSVQWDLDRIIQLPKEDLFRNLMGVPLKQQQSPLPNFWMIPVSNYLHMNSKYDLCDAAVVAKKNKNSKKLE